jgi:opacity protein-like surface antigen
LFKNYGLASATPQFLIRETAIPSGGNMNKFALLALVMAALPASAYAQDETSEKIGGLRVEARVGIERPNLNDTEGGRTYVAKLSSSFAYGLEAGYDVPVSKSITVGPYVSYDKSSSKKCEQGNDNISGTQVRYNLCTKSKSDLSFGVRGGFRTGGKGELYLGLGYDIYNFDLTEELRPVALPNAAPFIISDTKKRKGVGVSFGYNHNIGKNVYAGLGFRVSEFGSFVNSEFSLQRTQGQINLGARF